jgi:hypothetical protein
MRAALDDTTVDEYYNAMLEAGGWGAFPACIVYYDGHEHWLADGFHRVAAARRLQIIPGYAILTAPCDVRAGTQRDAILYAAGANAGHGLRRTNADKQRSVEVLLRDPEWSQWSDREIARRCAVSDRMVNGMRAQLTAKVSQSTASRPDETTNGAPSPTATADSPAPILRRGGDGRTINTANIGQRTRYAEVWELHPVVRSVVKALIADDIPADIVAADLRKCASRREGETWRLAQQAVEASGLVHRVPDLMQAMNNVAHDLERRPAPAQHVASEPQRPPNIGLVAWEAMDGTNMRENSHLLNDLAPYDGEAQARIVEALASGRVGTVASAAATLKIVPAEPEPIAPYLKDVESIEHVLRDQTPEVAVEIIEGFYVGNDNDDQPILATLPEPTPLIAAAKQRQTTLQDLLHVYQTALAELDQFAELTGHFTWVAPTRRALEPIVTALQGELLPLET